MEHEIRINIWGYCSSRNRLTHGAVKGVYDYAEYKLLTKDASDNYVTIMIDKGQIENIMEVSAEVMVIFVCI